MTDEGFEELARSLRQGVGEELRAEAREDEALTEVRRRRHRSLADAARAALYRGDRVTVRTAGGTFAHPLVSVGDDYLLMDTGDALVDVLLASATLTVEGQRAGGTAARPLASTFKARLAEHEQEGHQVEVVTIDGSRHSGRVAVAARDHIIIDAGSGAETFVPYAAVAVVFSPRPRRR